MANVTLRLSIGTFSVEVSGPSKYAEKKLKDLIAKYLSSSVKSGGSGCSACRPRPRFSTRLERRSAPPLRF